MKITKAMLSLLIMAAGLFPAAFAITEGDPNSVTYKYINEADGREIAASQTVKTTEVKKPQSVSGYSYQSFSEVTEHIYAKEDITYIQGYPDKTVRGERFLSRAETAAVFYRLYDGYYPKSTRQMTSRTFSDVPRNAWYYAEVELCYNAGIINGYADGSFRPDEPVTRAEFAVIVSLFEKLPASDKDAFRDVTKEYWAEPHINAAANAGWIRGYGDGTYRPETAISRSEAVTLINRMRNRSITAAELRRLGVRNPYIDLSESYWAYAGLIEATVKHSAADWHGLTSYRGQ